MLALGLRGLLTRKPFLLSSRVWQWALGAFMVTFALSAVELLLRYPGSTFSLILLFPVAVWGVLVFRMVRQPPSYIVIGVSEDAFYNALRAALLKLDLPYTESAMRLQLTSINANLRIAASPSSGVGTLTIAERQHAPTLKAIADALGQALSAEPGPLKRMTTIVLVISGVLGIAFAIYLAFDMLVKNQL